MTLRKAMLDRTSDDRGWVLVTAISLMSIMMIIALASMSIVDTQQKRDRQQRERESSLNMAEAVLYAQGFQMARGWPSASNPAPISCSSATAATGCPTAAQVSANISNVDTKAATTWTTKIRDNGGNMAGAYQLPYADQAQSGTDASGSSYTCAAPCRYDANGDRSMWVQAESIVRGRKRTVVATLKLEQLPESTPQAAVVAGGINTGNNGSQIKIYAVGSQVVVRCDATKSKCVSDPGGIQPSAAQGNPANLMTPTQIERFRQRAIADNTYYAGCPTTWNISGSVVFIDKCNSPNLSSNKFVTSTCPTPPGLPVLPGGGGNSLQAPCINTIAKPGLLIWHCATSSGPAMDISGKATFVGVMYFVNSSDAPTSGPCAGVPAKGANPVDCSGNSNSANNVLSTTGGFGVWGAVAIDGNGCLYASANGIQVFYDANVWKSVSSYGTVGLVQDTWRELIPN